MFTEVYLFLRLYNGALEMPLASSSIPDTDRKYAHTDRYILMSISENAYLLDLLAEKVIYIGFFYGDALCGIISQKGDWMAVGGSDGFAVRRNDLIRRFEGMNVYDMRQSGPESLLILEDPWMEDAAIWEFNVRTALLEKVRPFPDYARQPYTENVIW
ncbi:hypothetical protein [Chitinophaga caseinilytica]|uniref:hypothetical protein n=1 Tax=Chitinophaga caseinilytica TaxID=2267521 RepID=UPI003C2F86A7